ncbi:MAG: flagellar export chaperone FliS [Armatimonadetes bacterium]|nr:flagellar export chaperone FliS [Armatimonadota bacterium]
MSYNKHLQVYQNTTVQSASPLQLVIMLYDGAVRSIKQGELAMANGDLYQQNHHLTKAQKIVAELIACLDLEKGGEVATNLFALYSYIYNELVQANVEDQTEPLQRSLQVLEGLRASWVELEKQTKGSQGESDGNVQKAA